MCKLITMTQRTVAIIATTDPTDPDAILWLTKEQAAARLQVSPRTLDRFASLGRLTKYGFDDVQQAHVRFKAEEVDRLLRPLAELPQGQEENSLGGQ